MSDTSKSDNQTIRNITVKIGGKEGEQPTTNIQTTPVGTPITTKLT